MLIKSILSTNAKSDQEYRKVIKRRQNLCFIVMLIGITTAGFSFYFSNIKPSFLSDFFSGFYCGCGTGLVIGGILAYIKYRSLLKNEKRLHEKRLAENDERNQMISQKAFFMTSIIMIAILYTALLLSGLLSTILFQTLLSIVLLYFLIFLVTYIYYNKKF